MVLPEAEEARPGTATDRVVRTVLAAGSASAEDPAHTVGPPREAAEQRAQRS
ncbi:hypothetical protein ACFRH6_27710 [Streptomyces sp. NPDC056749]|uniref:hypothetical protein n=1 Tax=Streptomyces sp. NPDC056749 TaxID=3345936 RepID=UPI0036B08317